MRNRGRLTAGWIAAGIFISAAFFILLHSSVSSVLFENDLWWMIPSFEVYTEGRSLLEQFLFLVNPAPIRLGQGALKMMLWLHQQVLGGNLTRLVWLSVGIHFLNAGLVFALGKAMGWRRRDSGLSALVYLAFFPQFHAYLWPVASQHLIASTTLLGLLTLYWMAERSVQTGPPAWQRRWRMAAFAVGLLGSLQRSVLLAPGLIGLHILFRREGRVQRWDRWLPLFALFLPYPLWSLTVVGDDRLTTFFAQLPFSPSVRFLLFFIPGVFLLLLSRRLMRGMESKRFSRGVRWVAMAAVLSGAATLICLDRRQLFLGYNGLVPLWTCLGAFLQPVQAALRMNGVEPFCGIPPQISPLLIGMSAILLIATVRSPEPHRASFQFLGLWYLLLIPYLIFHYGSYPMEIPSRYFIYLGPPFALWFVAAASRVLGGLSNRWSGNRRFFTRLAGVGILGLCLSNVVAIRLGSWRNRLVNNFFLYSEIRVTEGIRADLKNSGNRTALVRISGVQPMPYDDPGWAFVPADRHRYQAFQALWKWKNGQKGLSTTTASIVAESSAEADYRVVFGILLRKEGEPVEEFEQLYSEALRCFERREDEKARRLFEAAVRERPFLLRFLLGVPENRLSDLRWVTGGLPLGRWVHRISDQLDSPEKEISNIRLARETVSGELDRTVLSLFLISYLEDRRGDFPGARRWVSQIRWFEEDPEILKEMLHHAIPKQRWVEMEPFLERAFQPDFFGDPLPWRYDDYGFGRFLIRWVFGKDVHSSWDQKNLLL